MNRVLVAGAAIALAAASFTVPASAQGQRGRDGGGGAPSIGGHGPSGGAGPAIRGGGGGGPAFRAGPQGGGQVMQNRGAFNRGVIVGSRGNRQAQVNPQFRNNPQFRADRRGDHRRHFRGPGFAFGFAAPYPYYDYGYYDDCLQMRRVWTDYGWQNVQVNVCTDDQYQYQYQY